MRSRVLVATCGLLLLALPLSAHVGSSDVFYEGDAGAYHLFVTVRVPQVIPGVAEIQVRSGSNDVRSIQVVVLNLTGPGSTFPPIPDLAQPSKADPQFFTSSIWLMESGGLQVRLVVDGSKGNAELPVPVPSFAQRTLPMQQSLGWPLFALTLFLAVGVVSIVYAGVREGNLEPGADPAPSNRRRAQSVAVVTAVLVVGILYMGRAWWGAEARDYQRHVDFFKSPIAETTLVGNRLIIRAKGQDPAWPEYVNMEEVIPDHGHLMHLFLLRTPGMDHLWHLHPVRIEGGAFADDLPSMPPGHYQIFADVVDKSGYPWTLVGKVDLPQISGKNLDDDDATWSGAPLASSASDSATSPLPDGARMVWQKPPGALRANVPLEFVFNVEDKDGNPVHDMQPYMGMAGHAEFVRSDFNVFVHVHPAGSVSMAALELAQAGLSANSSAAQSAMAMPMPMSDPLPSQVRFPYGFPQSGDYRIFVQIKRAGRIETGIFDARVQ